MTGGYRYEVTFLDSDGSRRTESWTFPNVSTHHEASVLGASERYLRYGDVEVVKTVTERLS